MDAAGEIVLRPRARGVAAVSSTRRAWSGLLGRGQPAQRLPDLLAGLYALCGHAHRLAAQRAVAAARGEDLCARAEAHQALVDETLREHLRRWWLDAPGLVDPSLAPDPRDLAASPALSAGSRPQGIRAWVETHILGCPARDWLAAWHADPEGTAREWADHTPTWPARWTRLAWQQLGELAVKPRPVPLPDTADRAARLGQALVSAPDFVLAPLWQGAPAETGPWWRAASAQDDPPQAFTAVWMRAAARAADVARLLTHDGDAPALAIGAWPLGPRAGLGWCEMARGLLVHRVELDAQDRVVDCQVLAPTEWNFHPAGAVAQALAVWPADAPPQGVRWLAAAFDPCVACRVDTHPAEPQHA